METEEKIFEQYQDVIDFKQLQKMLGNISKSLGYKLLRNKEIKSFKCGREYRILKIEVIKYIRKKSAK